MKPRKHCYADGGKVVKDHPVGSDASPGISGAIGDAIRSVGNYIGRKATEVPSGDKSAAKPRSLRQKQMDDLGL